MERCSLQFALLKDTAQSVRNNNMAAGSEITIGVRQAEFVKDSLSTLKTLAANNDFHVGITEFTETPYGYEWTYRGVPIRLHIIKRNYEFLKNLEPVWFWGETLFVPNPFDKYYKARHIVQ